MLGQFFCEVDLPEAIEFSAPSGQILQCPVIDSCQFMAYAPLIPASTPVCNHVSARAPQVLIDIFLRNIEKYNLLYSTVLAIFEVSCCCAPRYV